ncbi:gas vesicle protein GvpL/GvpF [Stackebrandtia endophytica]|uniref:Gas vesicle protein GvpL/GvpF n=1 Tax=Stackebrandtia endophytica TaxID=1496996 RepID=A0A543B1U4_9ACTN|nr:GvpL/GvpF family gas vesicle protein [Stackebrandtia endophytica]TQL78815.1 gas vesicle protein GvpL/GvpF [Stackebrandtia endophytica]
MTNDREAVWLYAVIHRGAPEWARDLTGVGGGRMRTVTAAGLTALVETVTQAEFGEQVLPTRLEDMETLATIARTHDAVVETAVRHTTTVPMRLATMYFDDAGVERMLAEHRTEFNQVLDLIEGCAEWGVKGYVCDPTPQPQRTNSTVPSGGGAAYLRRRREQLATKNATENLAYERAESIHTSLSRFAKLHRRHQPQDAKLTGADTPMVLNGAYLVPHQHTEEFGAAVSELTEKPSGVRLELTGPWPAYSFARGPGAPV